MPNTILLTLCSAMATVHALREAATRPRFMKSVQHSIPMASRAASLAAALPASAHAASVSYDFAYRLERAIDPEKRGPATEDAGGMSALDAMCNPPVPFLDEPAEAVAATQATAATAVSATASGTTQATAASAAKTAAAAAVVAAPVDPASSMEPLLSSISSGAGRTLVCDVALQPTIAIALVVFVVALAVLASATFPGYFQSQAPVLFEYMPVPASPPGYSPQSRAKRAR